MTYTPGRSHHHNLAPKLLIGAVIIGAVALAAYNQSRHPASPNYQPSAPSQTATSPVSEVGNAKCHMRGLLPDPICTPGSIDPAVTDQNVATTICKSGYTASIRPASSYTSRLKRQQMAEYGFTDSIRDHEEDHLISLELGGAAADPTNLWPEPQASPNDKDRIENFMRAAVCAGRISLSDAQHRIATDWTTAEAGLTH
ncbi:MAG: hypothetical protein QFB87_02930 [Patescibacteria group bacterium]|nr:hypothetical protein [Patescibacteria group bacterium]